MPEIKTKATPVNVADFLDAVPDPVRREDGRKVCAMMERITGEPPKMWGPSIIGFGSYTYKYDSGHGGTMCRSGFSPRMAELVFYVNASLPEQQPHLAKLGKHKIGKGCLYIKKLADVDETVLEDVIRESLAHMNSAYSA